MPPVPGEFWEDTLHRTCESILTVNLRHPNIRIMQLQTQLNRRNSINERLLPACRSRHAAQVYEVMYGVLRSFLTGFIDVAAKRQLELEEQGDDSNMRAAIGRASPQTTPSSSASAKVSTSSSPAHEHLPRPTHATGAPQSTR